MENQESGAREAEGKTVVIGTYRQLSSGTPPVRMVELCFWSLGEDCLAHKYEY